MKKSSFLKGWDVSQISLLVLLGGSTVAQAGYLTNPWENHFQSLHRLQFGLEASSLSSTANFSKTSEAFTPPGFEKLSRLGVDLHAAYGLGDRFTPYVRLTWANLKTEGTIRPGTSFGFSDQAVGGVFRIAATEKLNLDAQVQGEFPGYSNSEADDNLQPYLGDGSVDFSLGGFFGIKLVQHETESLLLEGGAGYHLRGSGFSAAIPWSVKLHYDRARAGIIGEAGIFGYQSLNNDEKRDLVVGDRDVTYNVGTSRSYFSNAVNPSLLSVGGKIGYQADAQWRLYAGIQSPLSGKSAAKATQFLIGLTLRDQRDDGEADRDAAPARLDGLRDEEDAELPNGPPPGKEELSRANKGFISYSMDAKVVRVNDKLHLVKIDKGHDSQVQTGQRFDIFSVDDNGAAIKAVARARVTSVRATEAALEVTEYFEETLIDEGFVAKRIGPN